MGMEQEKCQSLLWDARRGRRLRTRCQFKPWQPPRALREITLLLEIGTQFTNAVGPLLTTPSFAFSHHLRAFSPASPAVARSAAVHAANPPRQLPSRLHRAVNLLLNMPQTVIAAASAAIHELKQVRIARGRPSRQPSAHNLVAL